jgi:hypothetical protein
MMSEHRGPGAEPAVEEIVGGGGGAGFDGVDVDDQHCNAVQGDDERKSR